LALLLLLFNVGLSVDAPSVDRSRFSSQIVGAEIIIISSEDTAWLGSGGSRSFKRGAYGVREPIMGVWELCPPQWVQGQSLWSGGEDPPEAERIFIING